MFLYFDYPLFYGGWLRGNKNAAADTDTLTRLRPGLTPEIVAAVSKVMKLQDLIAIAARCRVITRFRNTIGLPGRLAVRLQPNHPTDDPRGVAASTRKPIDCILCHAATNLALGGYVLATDSWRLM